MNACWCLQPSLLHPKSSLPRCCTSIIRPLQGGCLVLAEALECATGCLSQSRHCTSQLAFVRLCFFVSLFVRLFRQHVANGALARRHVPEPQVRSWLPLPFYKCAIIQVRPWLPLPFYKCAIYNAVQTESMQQRLRPIIFYNRASPQRPPRRSRSRWLGPTDRAGLYLAGLRRRSFRRSRPSPTS